MRGRSIFPGVLLWMGLWRGAAGAVTDADMAVIPAQEKGWVDAAAGRAMGSEKEFARLAQETPPGVMIEVKPGKIVEGVLEQKRTLPNYVAQQWLVYLPSPPELPGQKPVRWHVDSPGPATEVTELGPERRHVLRVQVGATMQTLNVLPVKVTYEVALAERNLVARPAGVLPLAMDGGLSAEQRMALLPTVTLDYHLPVFQTFLETEKLRPEKGETDMQFATRVFLLVAKHFTYENREPMERRASRLAGMNKTDCGGMEILFCSILRANGIPARLRVGRLAKSSVPGEKMDQFLSTQQHVRGEFYAWGVGWVPEDVTEAEAQRNEEAKMAWFGHDHADFVTLHLDADIVVDTLWFGPHALKWLQTPQFWARGNRNFEGKEVVSEMTWSVKELPLPAGATFFSTR